MDKRDELIKALKAERAAEEAAAEAYNKRAAEVFDALWVVLMPHIAAVETHYADFAVDLSAEVQPVVRRVVRLFAAYDLGLNEADVPASGEATVFVLRNSMWRRLSTLAKF